MGANRQALSSSVNSTAAIVSIAARAANDVAATQAAEYAQKLADAKQSLVTKEQELYRCVRATVRSAAGKELWPLLRVGDPRWFIARLSDTKYCPLNIGEIESGDLFHLSRGDAVGVIYNIYGPDDLLVARCNKYVGSQYGSYERIGKAYGRGVGKTITNLPAHIEELYRRKTAKRFWWSKQPSTVTERPPVLLKADNICVERLRRACVELREQAAELPEECRQAADQVLDLADEIIAGYARRGYTPVVDNIYPLVAVIERDLPTSLKLFTDEPLLRQQLLEQMECMCGSLKAGFSSGEDERLAESARHTAFLRLRMPNRDSLLEL